jgi:flagellar basal body-associated protein FliL
LAPALAHWLLKAAAMNKKLVIIGAGALAGVLSAGAGVYFFKPDLFPGSVKSNGVAAGKPAKTEAKDKKHESEVGADLEVFVVNLAGSGQGRYLRTTLSLGVKSEHEKERVKEFTGPIRHAVIMYLTERKVEELLDPQGKENLRNALHEQINVAIGHKIVSSVYFKEFLIQ